MTPSDDLSPPRRPIFFPVVIATVFLTIIGLTAGFVLGEKRRDDEAAERAQNHPTSSSSTPAEIGTSSPAPSTAAGVTSSRTGAECPPETRQLALEEGFPEDLRQVHRYLTENGTTVWICDDAQGRLYYQSKTGGRDAKLQQRVNGLFLPGVAEQDGGYFAKAANGNTFTIDDERLVIQFVDGKKQTNRITSVE